MYKQESLRSDPKVFLDPNKLSEDGTISLRGSSFTKDGTIFAYGLSQSGSDWSTIKVKAFSGEILICVFYPAPSERWEPYILK